MRVTFTVEHDFDPEKREVVLDDSSYDVVGWADLSISDSDCVGVWIEDLYRACLPFVERLEKEKSREG
jgi:hypothetical protein